MVLFKCIMQHKQNGKCLRYTEYQKPWSYINMFLYFKMSTKLNMLATKDLEK
jgi:hypothetical protein